MIIIGFDPGLRHTGYGVINSDGHRVTHVSHGIINIATTGTMAERLGQLAKAVQKVMTEFNPGEVAVEETFVNMNPQSTLKLGMARGVVMMVPAASGCPVFEYPANVIKKAVVGQGHAEKSQVAAMVQRLLPAAGAVSADAADALALAITHAHHRSINQLVKRALNNDK